MKEVTDELLDALELAYLVFLINAQYTTPFKKLIRKYKPDSEIIKFNCRNMPTQDVLIKLALRMENNE